MARSQQAYGATTDAEELSSRYELHCNPADPQILGDSNNGRERFKDEDDDDDEEYESMSLTELLYSSASYHAIAKPVSLTMILAALSVVYINDAVTLEQGEQMMKEAYTVWNTDSSSAGKNLFVSLGNAFVMVCFICAMTFVIVFLYHMKCMKLLIGYMVFASASLLAVLGGTMLSTAIEIYDIPIDKLTFCWFLYNFAVVGIIAIFWTRGVPKSVTQGYLIATSVILAWQLAHFDTWTTWTLLVMLALYDLCAVLTPCGPLKALVNLMQRDDAPAMPGLLYEAHLPPEAQRPGGPPRARGDVERPPAGPSRVPVQDPIADDRSRDGVIEEASTGPVDNPVVEVPLAIARVYNLKIVGVHNFNTPGIASSPLLENGMPMNPTITQLRSMVMVELPRQGGRIELAPGGTTYLERDRFGTAKRKLWVDKQGKVFAEACDEDGDDDSENEKNSNSIRLGLGDFIFYSVLVAKAAQYSFATFAACMLVILAGLGGTLILLAVFHHALPALPISIFLGVVFYVLTRLVIEPWIEAVMTQPFYV